MDKGIGFLTAQETTVALLKTFLISFWLGADALAILVVSVAPREVLANLGVFAVVLMVFFFAATVFSTLFVSIVGRCPARQEAAVPSSGG